VLLPGQWAISSILPGFQDGCRREWLRVNDSRYKMEMAMSSFSPAFNYLSIKDTRWNGADESLQDQTW
jgi:hypothetical protein